MRLLSSISFIIPGIFFISFFDYLNQNFLVFFNFPRFQPNAIPPRSAMIVHYV